MQVYELMNRLKDFPAGAEVMIDTLVKDSDLDRCVGVPLTGCRREGAQRGADGMKPKQTASPTTMISVSLTAASANSIQKHHAQKSQFKKLNNVPTA